MERAHKQLQKEFEDVLQDPAKFKENEVLPTLEGPAMEIHLLDDTQCFFVSTTRTVP